jgi:mRNA interferase MazF
MVTILFPFSDLSTSKARPALIVIDLPGEDVVVAQMTSSAGDPNAISLEAKDFQAGGLNHSSFIRPAKLFAIERRLIGGVVGKLAESKRLEVVSKLTTLISYSLSGNSGARPVGV